MNKPNESTTQTRELELPPCLKLWICCHCRNPRLKGSDPCKYCGALLHDTGEYVLADEVTRLREALESVRDCQNEGKCKQCAAIIRHAVGPKVEQEQE